MTQRPYELHSNRELEFMLGRGKPFAHFSGACPAQACEDLIPEEAFAPYVASAARTSDVHIERPR